DTGQRGLSERRAEERHAAGHDEMAETAEDRREHEHAQKAAHEKRILKVGRQQPAGGQLRYPAVERTHDCNTASGPPSFTTRRSNSVTRSATRRTWCASCDTMRIVVRPSRRRVVSVLSNHWLAEASRPVAGSSRIKSSGSGSRACARSTRRNSPPDRTDSGRRS